LNKKRDLPTLGGAQTCRSEKEVFALVDLGTFVIAVFCLIDDRLNDLLGRLRTGAPSSSLGTLQKLYRTI
jgi:hypothetical protein